MLLIYSFRIRIHWKFLKIDYNEHYKNQRPSRFTAPTKKSKTNILYTSLKVAESEGSRSESLGQF
jgi:hypothetical protein